MPLKFRALVIYLFVISFIVLSCSRNEKVPQNDYADVFKPLDGTWEGEFKVFVDTLGQKQGISQPKKIDYNLLNNLSLKLQSIIKAKHVYKSVTPFRQEGEITDFLIKADGTEKIIKSNATNLIENGKLKCIVNKPNETVIHEGKYLGDNTIIWQRSLTNPLKIEYFKESVSDGHYKIIGWGYYGNDNPKLTPRIWFYADYIKTDFE
jgi:hypothetical protein